MILGIYVLSFLTVIFNSHNTHLIVITVIFLIVMMLQKKKKVIQILQVRIEISCAVFYYTKLLPSSTANVILSI